MRVASLIAVAAILSSSGCYLFHVGPDGAASPSKSPTFDAPDAAPERCEVHTYQVGEKFEPIDMVWVVDSSRSMTDEQARIRSTINQFVSDIAARSFDVRLVMITAQNIVPPPLGSDASRYLFVEYAVGSHAPLQALLDTLPRYQDFLRPAAALHFVVVTDDDSSLSAEAFLREMRAHLARSFIVHAVASPNVDGAPCRNTTATCTAAAGPKSALCGAAAIGTQYYALAEELGGEEISICVDDWSQVFGPLLDAVGPTAIPCIIDLPDGAPLDVQVTLRQPGVPLLQLDQVVSEDACGRRRAFYFVEHAVQPQLTLCPAACGSTTGVGVEMRVATGCSAPQ
jgi:hypothetical protein